MRVSEERWFTFAERLGLWIWLALLGQKSQRRDVLAYRFVGVNLQRITAAPLWDQPLRKSAQLTRLLAAQGALGGLLGAFCG